MLQKAYVSFYDIVTIARKFKIALVLYFVNARILGVGAG